jgi:site-specific DNA-methyltransferase (adenine-specific)
MNGFSGYNYMSSYEPIIYGYKPDGARRRLAEPMKNILEFGPVPSEQKVHGFQKPQDLLRCLIKQSSHQGETVLDPFAGSASTLLAARSLGRSAIGFELNQKNFTQGQKLLQEGAGS